MSNGQGTLEELGIGIVTRVLHVTSFPTITSRLLDEMNYVPKRRYSGGEEILEHSRAIARKYGLYDLAVFQTTVTSTVWNSDEKKWHVRTDRGDLMRARFVVCANGTLSKPKLAKIEGIDEFSGHLFHTSRWDYDYTGKDLENLLDKRSGYHWDRRDSSSSDSRVR